MQLQFLGNNYQAPSIEIETTETPIRGTYRGASVSFRSAKTTPNQQPLGLRFRGTAY